MNINREINLSIILNYACVVIVNLSSVFLTPVIIKGLGLEQYGLYALVYSVVMYMTVNEFSVGNIVMSSLTKYREKKDKNGEENFLFHSFFVFLFIALFAMAVCFVININAPAIFKQTFSEELLHSFRTLFTVMTLAIFFQFFHAYFFAILAGYQKFLYSRTIVLVRICLRIFLIILFMKTGKGALSIFVSELLMNAATSVLFAAYAFIKMKVKIKKHKIEGGKAEKVTEKTLSLYINCVVDNIYWNSGNLIIAATHGASTVAVFSIFVTLINVFIQFISVVPGYYLPKVSSIVINDPNSKKLTEIMIKSGKQITFMSTLLTIGFALIGKDFIRLWIGSDFVPAYTVTLIAFLAFILPQGQIMGDIIIQAKNKFFARTLINTASTISCILVGYFFIEKYALKYSYMGFLFSAVVFRLIIYAIYYSKQGLDMKKHYFNVCVKLLPPLLITVCFYFFLSYWVSESVIVMSVKTAATCVVFAVSSFFLYWSKDEKSSLNNTFAKIKSKG